MNIKFIISLGMLVALTGTPCWGAAESDEQLARRLNYEELAKLCRGDYSNSKISQDIFEFEILPNMSAATLMNLAVAQPKLYQSIIKTIPQFVQLQQNMRVEMQKYNGNQQEIFCEAAWSKYPGVIDVVDYLAKSPYVNINAQNNDRHTALIYAIKARNSAIVKLLLDKGADISMQDQFSNTALMVAVNFNHPASVELLLAKGADVRVKDRHGYIALNYAADVTQNSINQNYQSRVRTIIELLKKAAVKQEAANTLKQYEK